MIPQLSTLQYIYKVTLQYSYILQQQLFLAFLVVNILPISYADRRLTRMDNGSVNSSNIKYMINGMVRRDTVMSVMLSIKMLIAFWV